MNRIITICLLIASSFLVLKAQLPNGSVAPDFIVTDVNGTTWHLYDILDQGKSVVLDFSATWCGICWNYHNTHVLDNLQTSYGPTGTNAIQVIFLEADLNTNLNCLFGSSGCVGGTKGNWVATSNYPIASLDNNLTQISYSLNGYPTLYGISPDRKAYEVGTASKPTWETWLLQSFKMSLSANVIDEGCQTLGMIDLSVALGYGNKTYKWSNGATTQDISGLNAGSYIVTVTDANGYAKMQTFTVGSSGLPQSVAAASNNIDCANSQVTVSGAGSSVGNNITYLWTTANGNILSGANTINALVNAAGTYNLKVTNNTSGCTSNASVQVTQVNNLPTANAGSPQTITCTTPQITLNGTATAGLTYTWSTTSGNIVSGANTLTPIVNAAGTYNLLVTNSANGCSASSSVLIPTDKLQPTISVTNGSLTCNSPTAQICATVPQSVNVSWNINGTIISTNCTSVASAGSYQATALAANGCTSTAISMVSAAPNLPQLSITPPPLLTCTNKNITLNGMLSGVLADHTITWSTSNGNIVSGPNTLTPVINKLGFYKMNALNNITNCQSSVEVTVAEFINTPIAAFTTSLVNGQLTLIGSNPNGSVTWSLGNGNIAGGSVVTVTYPNSNTYNICMTVTNECDQAVTCKPILYLTPLALTGNVSNPICNGDKGSVNVTAQGGPTTGMINYKWEGPNGFISTASQLSNLNPGIYNCIVSDAVGLTAKNSFNVVEPILIVATPTIVNATNGLSNGIISIAVVGGSGVFEVVWSNGFTGSSISNLSPGSYSAKIKDTYGCEKMVGPYLVQIANAVEENLKSFAFELFPNPSNNDLHYTITSLTNGEIGLELYNALNQRVWKNKFNGDKINGWIDLSDLPNGIYFFNVKINKAFYSKKIVINHY